MTLIALIGANALWLMYLWLASCIIAGYLSDRKGYGEKPGLATGLLPVARSPSSSGSSGRPSPESQVEGRSGRSARGQGRRPAPAADA